MNHSELSKVAFVVNLGNDETTRPSAARARHLAHLFHGYRLPATWAIDSAKRAAILQDRQLAPNDIDLALTIGGRHASAQLPSKQFQRELRQQLAALESITGRTTTLALGDGPRLGTRASILAGQGIRAIISNVVGPSSVAQPLACGLWRLEPRVEMPSTRRMWGLLPARRFSARQLVAVGRSAATNLVMIDSSELCRGHARGLQSLDRLLREVSWAASRKQLAVVTVNEIVAGLAGRDEVKPQRSILRVAA